MSLFKLQLSPGKCAEGKSPAQRWQLGQVGELVDAPSLCWAPALTACRHVPREMSWPCCQPGPAAHSCCSGLLAAGINPRGKIAIGNRGDCHGSLTPSALPSLWHLPLLQQGYLQWEAPGAAVGTAEPCCALCCAHLLPARSVCRAGPGGGRIC